ncbi:MAG: hypothetical protein ACHQ9S_22585 [Candidatus Binatia bacterium]
MTDTEVCLAASDLTVAWRGRVVLRGRLWAQPQARAIHLTGLADGDTVRIEARVEPEPTAPVAAAWLDFHWTADAPHPVRAWVPHLRPAADDVVADHSFRSPVAAMESGDVRVLLLPDVELLGRERALPAALDLDIGDPRGARLAYGLCASQPYGHTYFRRDPGGGTTQPLCFALHVVAESAAEQPIESSCARWVWRHTGTAPAAQVPAARARTQALPFAEHAARAYDAVFVDEWVEDWIGGRTVGGPINYGAFGQAVFFQAWFNALRSAIGLALLGKRLRRAAALVDAMPATDLLPTFYDFERRSWWGVGDDLIFSWVVRDAATLRFHHVPDVCETAKWMLAWHALIEPRPSFITRVRRLARFLAAAQAEDGSIPEYFEQDRLRPGPRLRSAAQCAIAGPILLAAGEHTAAVRLAEFLCREVVPIGRYFDYETFLSCSYKPFDFTDSHTGIAPQNTLSMGWTAECLMKLTQSEAGTPGQRARWLAGARRAIDQLCLYQQVWEPPFLSYRAFGGFGVMNTDGEWSDARQGPYGLLLIDAYRVFGDAEYFVRGVAALRAAFALQAIPENRHICPTIYDGSCPNWPREAGWDFRWDRSPAEMRKLPPGKSVENYGHGGFDSPGVRSAFDWGEGSAAACALMATERYGEVFVDHTRGMVFGLDGVNAVPHAGGFVLEDTVGRDRALRVRVNGDPRHDGSRDGDQVHTGARITVRGGG